MKHFPNFKTDLWPVQTGLQVGEDRMFEHGVNHPILSLSPIPLPGHIPNLSQDLQKDHFEESSDLFSSMFKHSYFLI